MRHQNERAPAAGNSRGASTYAGGGVHGKGSTYHVAHATAEPLLHRLEGVQKSRNGWRAKCPACGGQSRKLTIAERDNKVLLHCFAGCAAGDVLAAIGLTWADIMPPRHWPPTPQERERMQRAIRESGWAAAMEVLPLEVRVVLIAVRELADWRILSVEDDARLALALSRIEHADNALGKAESWRPDHVHSPARLVQIKQQIVDALRREIQTAEAALQVAETALAEHLAKAAA
ncbi:MAG: hypothetical protein QM599_01825 [Pseudoxanthomonas sp.]